MVLLVNKVLQEQQVGSVWSDTTANNTTPGNNVVDDIVTISDSTQTTTKKWNGSSWQSFALHVAGDTLIDGSLWTGGNIQSTNFSWAGGTSIPTGFKLSSTGYLSYNIIGGNIYGSHITGGTLDAGTTTINNLKVLGTALLPGLAKTYQFVQGQLNMPASALGANPPPYTYGSFFYIPRPFSCSTWSATIIVSVTNITNTGSASDMNVELLHNGFIVVSSSSAAGIYGINVVSVGVISGISGTSTDIPIGIRVSGYHSYGTFKATYTVIATVEN